ncbi:hypothetical protein [Marinoscillum sp.]|uniref:hypothetical protein n=1 Tax=Marinoscillum sp. TaxID=2024838 RepID=UPI003BA8E84F
MNTKTDARPSTKGLRFAAMLALTLGLAPFVPEPHILGKLRWVMGGAVGMQPMDWFDLALHGTPWVLLVIQVILYLKKRF